MKDDFDPFREAVRVAVEDAERNEAKQRRERIATAIYAARRANPNNWWDRETAAATAVGDADALIAELDREVGK